MRCSLQSVLVSCLVIGYAKAQYDEEPPPHPEEGVGNPYYEQEGGVPNYDQPPPPRPPQNPEETQNPLRRNQPYQGQAQQGDQGIRRTTTTFINETFSLPSYYDTLSTTRRTVKVNRRTYQQMIDILLRDGALKTPRVIEAFQKVDRGYFVHPLEDEPYGFMIRKLGRGVFIEKPHFQAKVLELLAPAIQEGAKVLDLGSGSGFMSCVMAELAGKSGRVIGLEHIKEACEDSWDTIMGVRPDLLNDGRIHIRCKDARVGLLSHAPYDAIFVSPYIPEIPYAILLQLKPGGRLICGLGKGRVFQRMVVVDRSEDGKTFSKYDAGIENFINPLVNHLEQNDNWLYQQSRKRIAEAKGQGFSGLQLARKLKLFTKKPVDLRKLEDDTFRFIEV